MACLARTAAWTGVSPLESLALGEAPEHRRRSAASRCPWWAATCRAVFPPASSDPEPTSSGNLSVSILSTSSLACLEAMSRAFLTWVGMGLCLDPRYSLTSLASPLAAQRTKSSPPTAEGERFSLSGEVGSDRAAAPPPWASREARHAGLNAKVPPLSVCISTSSPPSAPPPSVLLPVTLATLPNASLIPSVHLLSWSLLAAASSSMTLTSSPTLKNPGAAAAAAFAALESAAGCTVHLWSAGTFPGYCTRMSPAAVILCTLPAAPTRSAILAWKPPWPS